MLCRLKPICSGCLHARRLLGSSCTSAASIPSRTPVLTSSPSSRSTWLAPGAGGAGERVPELKMLGTPIEGAEKSGGSRLSQGILQPQEAQVFSQKCNQHYGAVSAPPLGKSGEDVFVKV